MFTENDYIYINPKPNRLDCLSMNFAIGLQWAVKLVSVSVRNGIGNP